MKKNLAVIGGGVIAGHYSDALKDNGAYQLAAMCDIDPDCVSRGIYSHVPFYDDHIRMLEETNINSAVISTPPATHFRIAKDLLSRGVDVLLEKPMCKDYGSIEKLYDLSKASGAEVVCLFHWRYADEVMFLKEYTKGKTIKKIKTLICDNYCTPGTLNIKPKCLGLLGAWFDSGVNALSYIDLLVELNDTQLISCESIIDEVSGYPIYAKRLYRLEDTEIEIAVDWREDTREKTSVITLEDEELFVSHTGQTVTAGGKVIFSSPAEKRLASHYFNMLSGDLFKENNEVLTKRIHKILFEESK